MTIKIQYASDLHLEFYERAKTWEPILIPVPDTILVLAGDIGYPNRSLYKAFIEYCSRGWKQVYIVAGNHEFYNKDCGPGGKRWFIPETITARLATIETICAGFTNVHFLNRGVIDLDSETVLLGCTLWSQPTAEVTDAMNDTSRIWTTQEAKLTREDICKMNEIDKSWLRETVVATAIAGKKIVVTTHYLPTPLVSIDKYLKPPADVLTSGFANFDMDDLFDKVSLWICGHTHGCNTIVINKTTITTNTLGYMNECVEGYKKDAIVCI